MPLCGYANSISTQRGIFMKIRKKTIVLFLSYTSAAFLVFGFSLYQAHADSVYYHRQISQNYEHAFFELAGDMTDIDTALQKSLCATSPSMISAVCTDIFGKAASAQSSLAGLPFYDYTLEKTSAFINQVGDYAYSLAKKSSNGNGFTEEELSNLSSLSEVASELASLFTQLQSDVQNGLINIENLQQSSGNLDQSAEDISLGNNFKLMETEFPEIPTLIYDGPFSQHVQSRQAKSIENKSEIDRDIAQRIAANFLQTSSNNVHYSGESAGELPTYNFTVQHDHSTARISITKQGGAVLNMFYSSPVAEAVLSPEQAVQYAKDFLSGLNMGTFKDSYWTMLDNSIIIVNFAYADGDVLCYPDLVKVTVSLSDGAIIGYEATGYVMNHIEREIAEPKISEEEAVSKVSPYLTVLSHQLCIIPSAGKYEVFCHEFKCENSDGEHYIVYVNVETGVEENILILIEDENGTLTL